MTMYQTNKEVALAAVLQRCSPYFKSAVIWKSKSVSVSRVFQAPMVVSSFHMRLS